jgi:hypothetical protein
LHNAKTGGSTIKKIVNENNLLHRIMYMQHHIKLKAWKEVIKREGLNWKDIFKFAFVRNPWERNYAIWFFWNKENKKRAFDIRAFQRWTAIGISDFSDNQINNKYQHWFTHIDGRLEVDFIGRFENYFEDLHVIFSKLGLEKCLDNCPHINKNSFYYQRPHYLEFYKDKQFRRLIRPKFAIDAELFGYDII